jgi:hypothetical protein
MPSSARRARFAGLSSSGDIHVVDVSNMAAPKEVAFYTDAWAGTHNFSVDEPNGILYAAYYNGGVRALDVRGDLGTCTAAQKSIPLNSYRGPLRPSKMGANWELDSWTKATLSMFGASNT